MRRRKKREMKTNKGKMSKKRWRTQTRQKLIPPLLMLQKKKKLMKQMVKVCRLTLMLRHL
jgi:hypothetical protein